MHCVASDFRLILLRKKLQQIICELNNTKQIFECFYSILISLTDFAYKLHVAVVKTCFLIYPKTK